jgi:hypothetical protein
MSENPLEGSTQGPASIAMDVLVLGAIDAKGDGRDGLASMHLWSGIGLCATVAGLIDIPAEDQPRFIREDLTTRIINLGAETNTPPELITELINETAALVDKHTVNLTYVLGVLEDQKNEQDLRETPAFYFASPIGDIPREPYTASKN